MPSAARSSLLREVSSARYDVVVLCPPADTFSRSVFSLWPGPTPLRSAHWLRGFDNLNQHDENRVNDANTMLAFSLQILRAAAEASSLALLTFPEDLGPAQNGTPASLWQRSDARDLQNAGFTRCAAYWGEWSGTSYLQPTGVLTNAPKILEGEDVFTGWPRFNENSSYAGPLPPRFAVHVSFAALKRAD